MRPTYQPADEVRFSVAGRLDGDEPHFILLALATSTIAGTVAGAHGFDF